MKKRNFIIYKFFSRKILFLKFLFFFLRSVRDVKFFYQNFFGGFESFSILFEVFCNRVLSSRNFVWRQRGFAKLWGILKIDGECGILFWGNFQKISQNFKFQDFFQETNFFNNFQRVFGISKLLKNILRNLKKIK